MKATTQQETRLIDPDDLPIWVPGRVLCESKGLGWNGVAQRTYAIMVRTSKSRP